MTGALCAVSVSAPVLFISYNSKDIKISVMIYRFFSVVVMSMVCSALFSQTMTSAKVYREEGTSGSFFGKLYIPKGGKWKIERVPRAGDQVNLYRGHLDGSTLYMRSLDVINGCYWIDATQTDMVFVVRTTGSGQDVTAVPMTSEEQTLFEADDYDELYYYDKGEAKQNKLKYTASAVSNEELNAEGSTFLGKTLYVMMNPRNYGLAFAILNYQHSSNSLSARSVYVLGAQSAGRLNVVWDDDTETTAITAVEKESISADNSIYSLQGLRIDNPEKGGLYIRNGKKYVIR